MYRFLICYWKIQLVLEVGPFCLSQPFGISLVSTYIFPGFLLLLSLVPQLVQQLVSEQ